MNYETYEPRKIGVQKRIKHMLNQVVHSVKELDKSLEKAAHIKKSEYWCMGCDTPLEFEGDQLCPKCQKLLSTNTVDNQIFSNISKVIINFENCSNITIPGRWINKLKLDILNVSNDNNPEKPIDMSLSIHNRADEYIDSMQCGVFDRLKYGDIVSIELYTDYCIKIVYIPYKPVDTNLGSPNCYQSNSTDTYGNLKINFKNDKGSTSDAK